MSQVIDWEYYSSHFPTPVPHNIFDAVETQAEDTYNSVVRPYMQVPDEKKKYCIFQLCNKLFQQNQCAVGSGVSSTSNNGESVSYVIQTEKQKQNEIREIIYDCVGRLAGAF